MPYAEPSTELKPVCSAYIRAHSFSPRVALLYVAWSTQQCHVVPDCQSPMAERDHVISMQLIETLAASEHDATARTHIAADTAVKMAPEIGLLPLLREVPCVGVAFWKVGWTRTQEYLSRIF